MPHKRTMTIIRCAGCARVWNATDAALDNAVTSYNNHTCQPLKIGALPK